MFQCYICGGVGAVLAFIFSYVFFSKKRGTTIDASHGLVTCQKNTEDDSTWMVLENHTVDQFLSQIENAYKKNPALSRMASLYKLKPKFPNMSDYRLGPNMFPKTPLEWIVLYSGKDPEKSRLIGHGVMTSIAWNGDPKQLPDGWQTAVRHSYQQSMANGDQCNTLVGLFIMVENDFQKKNYAAQIIDQMRALARKRGSQHLIIPLRPPIRYEKEYAQMPFKEFSNLKREDGAPLDHWVRLHVKFGAKIIGIGETSHQHAMSLRDFQEFFDSSPIEQTGHRLVKLPDGWYNVYADIEHGFVLINQGCVWVEHNLAKA